MEETRTTKRDFATIEQNRIRNPAQTSDSAFRARNRVDLLPARCHRVDAGHRHRVIDSWWFRKLLHQRRQAHPKELIAEIPDESTDFATLMHEDERRRDLGAIDECIRHRDRCTEFNPPQWREPALLRLGVDRSDLPLEEDAGSATRIFDDDQFGAIRCQRR